VALQQETTDSAPQTATPWPVMVLAHNEERHIGACFDSIVDAGQATALDVSALARGCVDRTEVVVAKYGKRRPGHQNSPSTSRSESRTA